MRDNNKKTDFIKFDGEQLFADLRKKGAKTGEVSERIGYEKSYLSLRKKRGNIEEYLLRLICDLYALKIEDYIEKEETEKEETKKEEINMGDKTFQNELIKRLDKLIETLSYREYEKRMVTDEEDAILLLNHMLRHGSCEERVYKAKLKDAGIDNRFMDIAINKVGCTREVMNSKLWLIKSKTKKEK